MSHYLDLKKKIEELRDEAEAARLLEIDLIINEIREKVASYDISPEEIFKRREGIRRFMSDVKKLPPRYRDPQTGATWSGRGRQPNWMKGRAREEFLIRSAMENGIEDAKS
ncbi:H-NS histone family protein [Burkholderia ubonensis]|uniref:H-NS histone family protein n=1 Tax=Burkholderia ubonensis TaxID=101571 RepID=UPI0009B36E94|nr:H-NS histone family protein [Burkholderia ubonensis]